MKAYVVIAEGRNYDTSVSVHWSNTQCAEKIIALANSRVTDGSHVDSLGTALRALANMGVDVATYPVEVELPAVGVEPEAPYWVCGCGAKLNETQVKLSMARADGACPACKDCVSKELTPGPASVLSPKGFEDALDAFLEVIRELQRDYYTKHFKNLQPPTISVDPGGLKYLRIVKEDNGGSSRSVYCFVDKSNGDILKADGWKRPAKHARGNIFINAGKDAITPYGVHYLLPGAHAARGRNR